MECRGGSNQQVVVLGNPVRGVLQLCARVVGEEHELLDEIPGIGKADLTGRKRGEQVDDVPTEPGESLIELGRQGVLKVLDIDRERTWFQVLDIEYDGTGLELTQDCQPVRHGVAAPRKLTDLLDCGVINVDKQNLRALGRVLFEMQEEVVHASFDRLESRHKQVE